MVTFKTFFPQADRSPEYDRNKATELGRQAAEELLAELSRTTPTQRMFDVILRTGPLSTRHEQLPGFNYHERFQWSLATKPWELPAAGRFLDYAASHGVFRKECGSEELWRWKVCGDVVASALTRALNRAMFQRLCEAGEARPWVVEPLLLGDSIQRSIRREQITHDGLTWVDAACFLTGSLDQPFDLSPEVRLRQLPDAEHRAFCSQYAESLSRYFPPLAEASVLATVVGGFSSPQTPGNSDPLRVASFQIDLAKLALTARSSQERILTEGTILLFWENGVVGEELNRQARRSSHPCPAFANAESARESFCRIAEATEECPDFAAAVYIFGRATTAPFAREQVFEAVAGLERLLSPGTNPTYAVPLHAALLLLTPA